MFQWCIQYRSHFCLQLLLLHFLLISLVDEDSHIFIFSQRTPHKVTASLPLLKFYRLSIDFGLGCYMYDISDWHLILKVIFLTLSNGWFLLDAHNLPLWKEFLELNLIEPGWKQGILAILIRICCFCFFGVIYHYKEGQAIKDGNPFFLFINVFLVDIVKFYELWFVLEDHKHGHSNCKSLSLKIV